MVTPNPILIIRVEAQGVDPTLEDPEELAYYFLDSDCDDPSPALISAEWAS